MSQYQAHYYGKSRHVNRRVTGRTEEICLLNRGLLNRGFTLILKDVWPPRSPELTAPDCCLRGAMKSAVYRDNPHTTLN
jgi:hypothetical protein